MMIYQNWDYWLEAVLFEVQDVPQASTGFPLFELLYWRKPKVVMDV